MTAEQLRNSLLQEAISGRLVPQDPNDEPAVNLLNKLQGERILLLSQKKIIYSKPEKKAQNTSPKVEFDIPSNWVWCKLFDVARVFGRIGFRGYTKNDIVDKKELGAITLSPSNMKVGGMDYTHCTYISEEKYNESPEIKIHNNDVLIVKTGSSYGKTSLVTNLPWKSTINPQIAVIKDIAVDVKFFVYVLQSPYAKQKYEEFVLGTSIPTFSQESLISMSFPLPPLAEQKRIVAKLEELLPIVEEYGKAQKELEDLNAELPTRLRQSVLQEAITGKLVQQVSTDESVDLLVQELLTTKKQSSNSKKFKSEIITLDEIPFDVPSSWTWVRLGEIIYTQTGLAYSKGDLDKKVNNPVRVLRGGNIFSGGWEMKPDDVMIAPEFVKKDIFLKKNTFITPAVTSLVHLGKTALIKEDHDDIVAGGFVLYLIPYLRANDTLVNYLSYFFQTAFYNEFCKSITNKSGQAFWNISREKLLQLPIPIPPISEQQRIIGKLEEILPQIDKLAKL